MPVPSNPPWYNHPNNIYWRVQIMKLLIMQFSLTTWHFLPLKSKHFLRTHFSDTPNLCSTLELDVSETNFHNHIMKNLFRQKSRRQAFRTE
jgi:hypothetical protein